MTTTLSNKAFYAMMAMFCAFVLMGQGCLAQTEVENDAMTEDDEMIEDDSHMEDEMEDDEMMEEDNEMEANMMEDEMMKEMDDAMMEAMKELEYTYAGDLEDVSGSGASGTAMAVFQDGTYSLMATFSDLPDPPENFFYEGWIVRRGSDFSVLSSGVVVQNDEGTYENFYSSGQDLTDHTFYVLTIEPDDGDPAPADHVVEGEMTKK